MEPKGSLPHSQMPAICPYHQNLLENVKQPDSKLRNKWKNNLNTTSDVFAFHYVTQFASTFKHM